MTPSADAVADHRNLANLLAKRFLSAQLAAVPADFLAWAVALRATEYAAWKLTSGEISAIVVGTVAGRPIRVSTVFPTVPAWMRPVADTLPAFNSPAPAARIPLPEAA